MLSKIETWANKFDTPTNNIGFALFRISFAMFLLAFIYQVNYFRPLVFHSFPAISPSPFPAKLFLLCWFAAAFLVLIGFKTRFAALINYCCIILATFTFSNSGCGTFNDDLLRIGGLIVLFFPTHKQCSVDALWQAWYDGKGYSKTTSKLNYLSALFISLGLMYWASSITKLFSPIWQHGLGLWIPAVMPHNKWNNFSLFLNQKGVMMAINYITIIWEVFFIAAIFNKRWAWLFAATGIFFHLCIASIFPFWFLCFGPLPFYFLFVHKKPREESKENQYIVYLNLQLKRQLALARLVKLVNKQVVVYHQNDYLIHMEGKSYENSWQAAKALLNNSIPGKLIGSVLQVEFFRLLAKWLVDDVLVILPEGASIQENRRIHYETQKSSLILGTLILFCVQAFYTTHHLYKNWNKKTAIQDLTKKEFHVRKSIEDASLKPSNLFRTLFGLNARGLFLDHSSVGNKVMFAVTMKSASGENIWLPYFNHDGFVGTYNMNQMWSLYSFTAVCSGTIPNPKELEKTLTFWANKNRVNTDSLDLTVLRRIYYFPAAFEPNYLEKQKQLPWTVEGHVQWRKGVFSYHSMDSTATPRN